MKSKGTWRVLKVYLYYSTKQREAGFLVRCENVKKVPRIPSAAPRSCRRQVKGALQSHTKMACAIFIEMRGARRRWGKIAMVAPCFRKPLSFSPFPQAPILPLAVHPGSFSRRACRRVQRRSRANGMATHLSSGVGRKFDS